MLDEEEEGGDERSRRLIAQTSLSLQGFLAPPRDGISPSPSQLVLDKQIRAFIEEIESTHNLVELEEAIAMVLEQMITVESTTTADNADFLAGTQLDQPGVPGVYTIWGASTVGDTEMTVSLGGRTLVSAQQMVLRANSEIRENEDSFIQAVSRTGGRPVININVITAATVRIRVKFLPAMST